MLLVASSASARETSVLKRLKLRRKPGGRARLLPIGNYTMSDGGRGTGPEFCRCGRVHRELGEFELFEAGQAAVGEVENSIRNVEVAKDTAVARGKCDDNVS